MMEVDTDVNENQEKMKHIGKKTQKGFHQTHSTALLGTRDHLLDCGNEVDFISLEKVGKILQKARNFKEMHICKSVKVCMGLLEGFLQSYSE